MESLWLDELRRISAGKENSGVPIYRRLLNSLSAMIADGRLPDGTRFPPDSELAAQLDISHITWAKVLNLLTERGFAERSRRRGTFIRRPERTLAMKEGKANAVAVCMDDLSPGSCNKIFLETMESELLAAGFRPAFISAAASRDIQYAQIVNTMQISEFCGAFIWSLMDDAQVRDLLRICPHSRPLVFMAAEHSINDPAAHDFLHYDNFEAGAGTARRFIACGGKKFVCLLSEQHLYPSSFDRIRGIEHAVSQAGLPLKNVEIIRIDRDFDSLFGMLLKRPADTLIVAAAPSEVRLVSHEFEKRQLSPEDHPPVIGFSPDGFADIASPPFPLCRFDTADLCRKAVQCFIARMKNPLQPPVIQLIAGTVDKCPFLQDQTKQIHSLRKVKI